MKEDIIADKNLNWWQKLLMNPFYYFLLALVLYSLFFITICSITDYATAMLVSFLFGIVGVVVHLFVLLKYFIEEVTKDGTILIKVDAENKVVAVGQKLWIRKGEKCFEFNLHSDIHCCRAIFSNEKSPVFFYAIAGVEYAAEYYKDKKLAVDWQELADYLGPKQFSSIVSLFFEEDSLLWQDVSRNLFLEYQKKYSLNDFPISKFKQELLEAFDFRRPQLGFFAEPKVTLIVKIEV